MLHLRQTDCASLLGGGHSIKHLQIYFVNSCRTKTKRNTSCAQFISKQPVTKGRRETYSNMKNVKFWWLLGARHHIGNVCPLIDTLLIQILHHNHTVYLLTSLCICLYISGKLSTARIYTLKINQIKIAYN